MSQEIVETDALIIGGGIACIFAVLKVKDQGLDVTIADKGTVGRSGLSQWFCGYNYYDAASSGTRANWRANKSHGGEYPTNMDYVDVFIEDSKARYKDMVAMGADKENSGGHVAVLREKI